MGRMDSAIRKHYERLIISELDEFDGVVGIVWDRSLIRRVNIVSDRSRFL